MYGFVVCLDFKDVLIKEYFSNYCKNISKIILNLETKQIEVQQRESNP